jgi:ubiquinone biosynthesis protein UbiJ
LAKQSASRFKADGYDPLRLTPDLLVVGNEANRYIRRSTDHGSSLAKLKAKVTYVSLLHLAIATSLA